ncbi:multidrug ABC transporter ATP-binding protein [Levilactobacillus brevis]|uniref:ribosomal protection-like ABC-F family protein n=1 Tax=Levilactobacillus brevis TaxID=1580 RepID=UPI0005B6461E|nr:ABC-F type ribosomal protection protein [Levilactobacillus brevis]KIR08742.1 multidrug ABC transporter ATP-binding protein [Levilactobacillus brevis]
MTKITIQHLTFGFAGTAPLFDHVDLNLDTTWKLGLVGRNGRGKTTLLQLLLHHYPYQGTIINPLISQYFPAAVTDPRQTTIDLLQRLTATETWQLERELRQLSLNPAQWQRPFNTLSGGEQTKALLASLFAADNTYPLIDEPTNHLDRASRQAVATYLRQQRHGFIVVSHDRHFLNQITDHTLAIEQKQVVLYQGNFATYEAQKSRQDAFEEEQDARLKKEAARLKSVATDRAAWAQASENDKHGNPHVKNSGKQANKNNSKLVAKMMRRAKSAERRRDRQLAATEGLRQNIEHIAPLTLTPLATHYPVLLHVQDLTLQYPGGQPLFHPLSFELKPGERLALLGPNGSGKSSLLAYLTGHFAGTHTGSVDHPQLKVSTLKQQTTLTGTLADLATDQQLNLNALLNTLKKLGLPRDVFHTPIEQLSMGQQRKVALAQSLITPAQLFIWDEPLNYLDVFNQDQLLTLIQQTHPTLLVIEHDQHFIDQIATKQVTLTPFS